MRLDRQTREKISEARSAMPKVRSVETKAKAGKDRRVYASYWPGRIGTVILEGEGSTEVKWDDGTENSPKTSVELNRHIRDVGSRPKHEQIKDRRERIAIQPRERIKDRSRPIDKSSGGGKTCVLKDRCFCDRDPRRTRERCGNWRSPSLWQQHKHKE
jgi:hypothetical protein